MNRGPALAALCLVVAAAGCGGSDSREFTRAVPSADASSTASAGPASSAPASSAAPSTAPASTAGASAPASSGTPGTAPSRAPATSSAPAPSVATSSGTQWYRSSGGLYRSRKQVCVTLEEQWQAAVAAGRKSASVSAHDAAVRAGCDPAVWTPNGVRHTTVQERHADGESCTSAQGGTIAVFDDTYAVCTQQVEGVWTWEVAER